MIFDTLCGLGNTQATGCSLNGTLYKNDFDIIGKKILNWHSDIINLKIGHHRNIKGKKFTIFRDRYLKNRAVSGSACLSLLRRSFISFEEGQLDKLCRHYRGITNEKASRKL